MLNIKAEDYGFEPNVTGFEEAVALSYIDGKEEGREEGISSIVDLNNWLYDQSRDEDVKKATKDPEYLKQLLEEYSKEHGN